MSTIFFTGFPGFLGTELLPRVLGRTESDRALCLIQSKFADLARRRVQEIYDEHPELGGRIDLVEGDITRPELGLVDAGEVREDVSEIYHLAAVYDLSVPREVGRKVNVDGTRHVLDFASRCPGFERLHYVSTCFVSGRYAGIFTEDDLEKGQSFNNYYEETKHQAEVLVRRRMAGGFPATIYRPPIVVGDSRTGETQKYDGPYYIIRWVLRQILLAVVPVPGDPTAVRANLVPRDFVVDAITYLSGLEQSLGKTYQLADPAPLTVDELLNEIGEVTGRYVVRLPVLKSAAKAALDYVPLLQGIMEIPPSAVDYFVHPTHYTAYNTLADLAGSGIEAPPVTSYLEELVSFMKKHPEISSEAMV